MNEPKYSPRAEADLASIGDHGMLEHGLQKSLEYLALLEFACQKLVLNHMIGTRCTGALAEFERYLCGQHVIYFQRKKDVVLVVRILHCKMLPSRHLP